MFSECIEDLKNGKLFACAFVLSFSTIYIWILNGSVYASVAEYFGAAREIHTLVSAGMVALLAVVAQRRPFWLDSRLMLVIALGSSVAACLILLLAIPQENVAFTMIGFFFSGIGNAWSIILTALSLMALGSMRSSIVAVAFGFIAGELVSMFAPMPPLELGIALCNLDNVVIILLLYQMTKGVVNKIATSDAAADLETVNPDSFLGPFHPLFLCVLLVRVAFGYGITLNEIDHAPVSVGFIGVFVILIALWIAFDKEGEKVDSLFSFSALLIIAGFLIAPFSLMQDFPSANAFIRVGDRIFEILFWIVLAAVGRRNLFALLPTLGFARIMAAIGTDAGAIMGHTSNTLFGINDQLAALMPAIAAWIFIAFLWLGFRKFSFDATINGVASIEGETHRYASDDIERRCAEIGEKSGLTERETEIFAMLARGRNALFIREHYVVSRNTVKSHIRHIYVKLDIHSQQELIDLVETSKT